jgi:hypothetical protein
MPSSMKMFLVGALSGVALILQGLPAVAAAVPVPVLTDPKVDAESPAATANHLAWETNSATAQSHYNVVFASRGSTATKQVNAAGTEGAHPRALFGTETIVYQQYTSSSSDIYLYNMSTKQRVKLGAKVNTKHWEYWPAASTKYVLFLRNTTERQLLLYNRKSGSVRTLAKAPLKCSWCLHPEWVGDSHVIYTVCSRTNYACEEKVLTIGGTTQTVPGKSAPYSRFGGAMDEARGDVYYVSSNTWCGLYDEVDRWNIGGGTPVVMIADLAEGFDGNSVSVAPSVTTPGDVDLFYSDWECLKNDADIYEIDSANTIT